MVISVSLCLYGDKLNPAYVSEQLGVIPTSSQSKGEKNIDLKTGAACPPAKTGMWELESGSDSLILSDHINKLLSKFDMIHFPFLSIEGVEESGIYVTVSDVADENGEGGFVFELKHECIKSLKFFSLPIRFNIELHSLG